MELAKRYVPAEVERRIYHLWEDADLFRPADPGEGRAAFSIVIPPPNVTGRLHMGHALNNTLQDVLIRYRRMCGDSACWFPGTDHAGIATQNVVEKELAREGRTRHELGREAFVARVWEWKAKYGTEIIDQLKALGCSCDWSRLRFTLDEGLSRAVREVFVRLYHEGLIYRGEYLTNWCPRCGTALSDLEVDHREVEGALYYVRYPLEQGGHLTVATTRPETMLGDTGIAVHPDDARFQALIGKRARLPILGRSLPIVGTPRVDPSFGTGTLKVTPAHDPVDFEIAKAHGLESITILNRDGTLNDAGGPFRGMAREDARRAVVERLRSEGLLEKVVPYQHAVGHCERCDTAIEPLLSTQWFVRMEPLAGEALRAVGDGRIAFVPERWTKLYVDWLEGIRDWCISRQLWWGHRIPVWYGPDGRPFVAHSAGEATAEATTHYGRAVTLCQDEDVLDTWFSSWLWPFSVMGWPEETKDLETYFPTSVLVTGFDILFFWVSRMIMASLHFRGDVPFRTVCITPLIVDDQGQKMSKSKGNSVDPIDLVAECGADALRFAVAHTTGKGRTVRMPWSDLSEGRNFLNKVWNMARFVLLNLGEERPSLPAAVSETEDRFILSRLAETTRVVTEHLNAYNFNLAAEALYDFIWHDLCDWYLEVAKIRLLTSRDDGVRGVLCHVLRDALRLLHPFVPFLTEEIWQSLGGTPRSISVSPYPQAGSRDEEAEREMAFFKEVVSAVRTIRAELHVPPEADVEAWVKTPEARCSSLLEAKRAVLQALAGIRSCVARAELEPPAGSARKVLAGGEVFVPLAGLIDVRRERARLDKELREVSSDLDKVERNLGNPDFQRRAPREVVEKEERKRDELAAKRGRLEENLATLGG